MKIFMGMRNIASLMDEYAEGFRALGHEVFTVSEKLPSPVQGNNVDMCIEELVNLKCPNGTSDAKRAECTAHYKGLAWQKALEADVCFFIWNTFRDDCRDLAQLKNLGKKIVVRFCGSEVRDPYVEKQFFRRTGSSLVNNVGEDPAQLYNRLYYLRMAERFADVLVGGCQALLRPSHGFGYPTLNTRVIPERLRQEKYPIILHAPSNRVTKGSGLWMDTFDALHSNGIKFGLRFVENIPHKQMLSEYAHADIYCGSLLYGGKADTEALAAGCVVLSTWHHGFLYTQEALTAQIKNRLRFLGMPDTDENFKMLWEYNKFDKLGEERPFIRVDVDNVVEELARIILDYPRRVALAKKGRQYALERYDCVIACEEILNLLSEPQNILYNSRLYVRDFFNLEYVPPNNRNLIEIYNKTTDMVRGCDWYSRAVVKCERHGLIF